MIVTKEMLRRCVARKQKQEATPAVIEHAESSRQKVRDNYGLEWEGLDESFWHWVGRYEAHEMNPQETERPYKGLLICGPVGAGKTTLAKYLSCKFRRPYYPMQEIDKAYGVDPEQFYLDYSTLYEHDTTVIIDDLGAEAGIKHYGNEPVTQSLLYDLYNLWDNYGKLVIITTNLLVGQNFQAEKNSITSLFGERIYSRFCEMIELVKVVKQDRRRDP